MDKNSQENVTEPTAEIAIDINSPSSETKDDNIISVPLETKDGILGRTKQHRESIDEIIVPQYIQYMDDQYIEDNYAVTYSEKDNSFLGWTINIEQNGQQHPDVYFKLDESYRSYEIESFKLCKRTLLFCYKVYQVDRERYYYCKYLFTKNIV